MSDNGFDVSTIGTASLLATLNYERCRFLQSSRERMQAIVDELVNRGEYKETPAMKKYKCSFMRMVDGYGAWWHHYRTPLECPHCKVNLRDEESGPPFKREVGKYNLDTDQTTGVFCPDCKKEIK